MKVNPEQWFDENKHVMPKDIVEKFELLRMFLRGWTLYEKICEPLAKEMIAHACSKVDDPEKIYLLNETLTLCANYYIMVLCSEVEALLKNDDEDYPAELIDENIEKRNKVFDAAMSQKSFAGTKVLSEETVEIFQKRFLSSKPELLEIESKWWQFYKYTFWLHGMRWQIDAYQIVLELRKGKKPDELIAFTHENEFDAVKGLVDVIEDVERERDMFS